MVGLILSGEKEKKTEREIYFRIGERESCLVHLEIVLEETRRRHKTETPSLRLLSGGDIRM
jgi:hypothetical protein